MLILNLADFGDYADFFDRLNKSFAGKRKFIKEN